MKKILLMAMVLTVASLLMAACGAPAANNASNAGNKAANTATAPAGDKAAVEGDIKKMIESFNAALNKGDAETLNKMYSDDYTLVDQNGAMHTKSSRLEAVKSGKLKWDGLKFEDLKIKTNPAGDGAVVVARASGKTIMDGKTEERNSIVTWVLGKMGDKGWQFVNAQITDIKGGGDKPADDKKDEPAANANAAPAK